MAYLVITVRFRSLFVAIFEQLGLGFRDNGCDRLNRETELLGDFVDRFFLSKYILCVAKSKSKAIHVRKKKKRKDS